MRSTQGYHSLANGDGAVSMGAIDQAPGVHSDSVSTEISSFLTSFRGGNFRMAVTERTWTNVSDKHFAENITLTSALTYTDVTA